MTQDAQHMPLSDVDKLRQDARDAAEVRALQTNPDVVALRVERTRKQVDRMMWAGLLLGLAFTMVNVQTFAAAGAAVWSLAWCAAWLLDPMVSLVLVAVLRAEQITARYQVPMHTDTIAPWVARTKLFAFAATYAMNTWQSWAHLHVAGIVLHSVPPVMVYLAAETGPILRDRLTEAITRAARQDGPKNLDPADNGAETVDAVPASVVERPTPRPRKASMRKPSARPRRTSRAEYLSRAREAHRPGIVVTPAWVREVVPDISRGTSQVVSNLLKAELSTPHITAASVPGSAVETDDTAGQSVDQGRAA